MTDEYKVAVIIPSYKVTAHIVALIEKIEANVHGIYIVDDCCPDNSGEFARKNIEDKRVKILRNAQNQGVGRTVIRGLMEAKADGYDIGVKLDGDGQMDPAILQKFISPIISGRADYTKGNRFFYPEHVRAMPFGRLVGNGILSFVTKLSTGYWNIFDPTNGYVAMNLEIVDYLSLEKVDKRYFFETDMLFRCNLIRAKVVDIPMKAIYEDEVSHLNATREAFRFMGGHVKNFFKRIIYTYFLRDFNIASLELIFGIIALLFGTLYGVSHYGGDVAATPGVVMASAFPLIVGTLLLLSFLNYDMQLTPREPIGSLLKNSSDMR